MKKRSFLTSLASLASLALTHSAWAAKALMRRVRPLDAAWPAPQAWDQLRTAVGGRLIKLELPFAACDSAPACAAAFSALKDPYYIRDEPALTQSMGWAGAWTSSPSAYALACAGTQDVVAAVNFARLHKLRLVVKGGGHSYQGTSNAPDSLLVWTRQMDAVTMHEAFVGHGCKQAPVAAVTVGAGAIWMHTYNAVTSKGGRYVQGGGCATVGVAGLIQSGGFGSFSKQYGLAAASLLEAEVVTADGQVRIANACTNPELFWALKGGGGGSLGIVTKVTLRTHELPEFFGVVRTRIKASSGDAYRRLIAKAMAFYAGSLHNCHWGEQMAFNAENVLGVSMVFQGLDKQQATAIWQPFFDSIAQTPQDYSYEAAPTVLALPSRKLWDPVFLKSLPGVVKADARPGAPLENVFWSANEGEAGQFLQGFQSAWMPASLLEIGQQQRLADSLFKASRAWEFSLHFNKGLAGAPPEALRAAADTATNPLVLGAFALAICAAEENGVHPQVAGRAPDLAAARRAADAIGKAMDALRAIIPEIGSYVSESDYFEKNWQRSFWGPNYPRLLAAKRKYDPDGLFFVHHGVGSEAWSADGFTRLA
ncbi:MAG: FAD-binding oxidoreductase [Pseudomonadota bacterium]